MKKTILILLCLVLLLSGCFYQPELRPRLECPEIWVCEEPYTILDWDKTDENSKIVVGENVYEIVFRTTAGPQLMVYDKEGKSEEENYYNNEYLLFRGHTTYEEKTAIVRVEKDFKNIFNGELPTLEFKRYDKEEYLKEKEE